MSGLLAIQPLQSMILLALVAPSHLLAFRMPCLWTESLLAEHVRLVQHILAEPEWARFYDDPAVLDFDQ